ncbi:MAG: 6,7-dimethyl-8-ribityllumazine synthase [Candidatus Omnitrophica bacterium]|nr:6,7-dimethyl-8-ribityllumazine synthase [Candidatus Omnitrophota bacterium]MDD5574390.1 6,7-dimethyl-8-ribityllumazine synthase [Candidatus Omnitrophota bacterium]
MLKVNEGGLVVKAKRFGIVVSRFNDFVTKSLLEGCCDTLKRHGAKEADIEISWVPGAFEIPTVALRLARGKKFDAVICLGTVIRGDTPHFDFIASEAAKGIASVSMQTGIPVIFGVITADTTEQAIERAGTKGGNKGKDAALNAIEMANLLDII